jgi:hypothetical protein
VAPDVAAAMRVPLGWTPAQTSSEIEAYRQEIESTRTFYR